MARALRERFARLWMSSATIAEVATSLGLSPRTVRVYASELRARGVDLPRMGTHRPRLVSPDAKLAARHAHEQHVTRAKAAQLYRVPLSQVMDAFARLYPESRRQTL